MAALASGRWPEEERSPLASVLDVLGADEQRRTRIAWLYHVEGLTQAEIAGLLDQPGQGGARPAGLPADWAGPDPDQRPARLLRGAGTGAAHRYGLAQAVVVPSPHDPAHRRRRSGSRSALGSRTGSPGQTLGIGWGRTLHWSVRALRRREVPGLTVVLPLGGIGRGSEINTYETASRVAETLGAQCYCLAAPPSRAPRRCGTCCCGRPGSRRCWSGRGGPTWRSSAWAARGRGHQPQARPVRRGGGPPAGAHGRAGRPARHLPRRGWPAVDHPLNRRAVGLPPEDLKRVPAIVLASAGPRRP